jgi:phage terminase large subunit
VANASRIERRQVVIPYAPRPQFVSYHNRTQRWAWIVAHRRFGKTVGCINELIKGALVCTRPEPRFAYIAPLYTQAKDVAWGYLKHFTAGIPGVTAHESELRVDLPNGGRVRLYGAENYDRMRGIYLDGAILDEYGDMDPRVWPEVIRPALSDRQGWGTFIGTPKGRNGFYELGHGSLDIGWEGALHNDEWYTLELKASETGILPQAELDDARKIMTPEQYEQEYECSFDAAIIGSYYGREIADLERQGRVRSVPWEPGLPVYTAWDLGLDDATAIWFVQAAGSEVRVIDYYETNNTALSEIARELLNSRRYTYGEHILPHDAEIRELMTAKSRKDSLEALGLQPIRIATRQSVEEGINASRMMLPKCVFDKEKCARGLEGLKQYRREWDEKRKTFKMAPLHDWTSHGADAFRYLAMMFEPRVKPQPIKYRTRKYA